MATSERNLRKFARFFKPLCRNVAACCCTLRRSGAE
jgi:hypothetical protein